MSAIHQFLPTFAGRDAIGTHCLHLRTLLRNAGYDSEIYALEIRDDGTNAARDVRDFRPGRDAPRDTWALYHFSVGSPMVDVLAALELPVGLDYHNITEARYLLRWEPQFAVIMDDGRRQLASMSSAARFAIAHSAFSESELVTLGFHPTAVEPILVDFADYDGDPDPAMLAQRTQRRAGGGADWLYVGRIAPNKCQHDVIAAFAVYRELFDRHARLTLVGGRFALRYSEAIKHMAHELGLGDAVTFTDVISNAELFACYRSADVFVSCSEHEGFNVPVLEAMHFDIPVVAYAAAAVPETVGDAGLLLDDKAPLTVAAAVHEVLSDREARDLLTAAGRERVAHFGLAQTGPVLLSTLSGLIACRG